MKNVIFVIGVLLSWYGCSDDNTGTLPISDVTRTTFVDERDNLSMYCGERADLDGGKFALPSAVGSQ